MSQRKLQQEMDRVFKRINEGLEIFNTLYERHQQSYNASQKEKLENDLKKEIKKLQRFREQVKNWQATNEVKDKDKLNEHRRLVETAMEQYKVVEKGSKTKAYSDESLANSHLSSFQRPEDEEKYALLQFVQHALDEIQRFQEMTESELDKLLASSKKSKRGNSYANEEKKTELEEMMAIHKFHQEKLEIILRLLENDILSVEEVTKIQEDVKYYLEENQSPDFINDDTIYDDLNLDSEESVILELQNSLNNANIANGEDSTATATATTSSPVAALAQNTPQKLKTVKEKSMSPQPQSIHNSSMGNSATSSNDSQGGLPPISSITSGSMTTLKPATAPVKPAELKWSVAAAASIANNNNSNNNGSSSSSSSSNSNGTNNGTNNTITATTNGNDQTSSLTNPSSLSKDSRTSTAEQISGPPGISTPDQSSVKLVNTNALNAASVLEALKKQKSQDETTETEEQKDQEHSEQTSVEQQVTQKNTSPTDVTSELSQNEAEIDNDKNFKYLPPGIQSTILSFAASRNRGLTPESTSYQLSNISTMLSIPRYFSPLSNDITPPGLEAQRVSTIWNSIRSSINLEINAQNLDSSTLFYAYYFGMSKYERDISERILISRRWQLHKTNRLVWYQRHSQVKQTADDFEIADYNVFDALSWSISEKKNFRVEFSQLV